MVVVALGGIAGLAALLFFRRSVLSENNSEPQRQPQSKEESVGDDDDVDDRNMAALNGSTPLLDEECDQDLEDADASSWAASQQQIFVVQDEPFEDSIQSLLEVPEYRVAFLPHIYTSDDDRLLLSSSMPIELMKLEDAEHRLSTRIILLRATHNLSEATLMRFKEAKVVCVAPGVRIDEDIVASMGATLHRLDDETADTLKSAMAAWAL